MSEEQFFQIFLEKVRETLSRLSPVDFNNSIFTNAYLSKWNIFGETIKPQGAIVACDGSFGESSFSGGLVVIVTRAIAHIYSLNNNRITSVFEVDTKAGYRLGGRTVLMKALELRVLRKALEKALEEHIEAFGIFDGSLYLTFLHHKDRLKKISPVFEEYVRELANILKLAEKGIKIIGISKDSDINYLRAKVVTSVLTELCSGMGNGIARRRSLKKLLKDLTSKGLECLDKSLRLLCLRELEQDFSDECLYSELTLEPGFTTPLLLAPQTIFLTGESKANGWRDTSFRKHIEKDEDLSGVLKSLDEYFSSTPIALTYWRPSNMSMVYRLDVPASLLGYSGKCEDLTEDVFLEGRDYLESMKNIVGVLNWMRQGPYAVYPLVEVDSIAKLDRSLYKSVYEPVIVEELKKRGFKVNSRKRRIRDIVLRGY